MALQVWLPLNKNGADKNQGLGDSIIANFGAVYESSGKLGGCYKCTKSAGIQIESKPWMKMVPGNSFSVSMWIKGCSGNTWAIACTSWELNFRTSVLSVYPGGSISNGGCAIYQTFDNDTWYHIAFSYNGDTPKLSLYLNGEFKQEYITTYTKEGIASTITLPYGDTRYINDFRIYDHCLSPKEVKEISKGLVLHYPLNDAYVEGTVNLGNASSSYSDKTGGYEYTANSWGGDAGTVTYYKSGGYNNLPYKVYHKTASGSGGIYGATKRDISIVAGKTYTMSVWVKASRNFSAIHYSFNINGITSADNNHYITYGKNVPFTTEWTRLSRTFTATELDEGIYTELSIIYDNWDTDYYVYFSGFQIEEKDHATPYTPNTRNETTVYDCSGYQNNGTITGALSCSADSPRYKISTHFTSSIPSRIMLPSDMSCLSGNNEQTLSCWVKSSGLGSGMSLGGLISLGYGNTLFLTASNYQYRIDNGSDLDSIVANQNPYDGNWHLVTATYKSGVASIYIDSILKNSVSRTFSNRYINDGGNCIGTEVNNGLIYNINGDISDVRMYATALSEEDIKELYNTSAYVLDNGTLLTYSVEE